MEEIKCKCGRITANLSGICRLCLNSPNVMPLKGKPIKKKKKKIEHPIESRHNCIRCTVPTTNEDKLCNNCEKIENLPKQCPKCSGGMQLKNGYLSLFWGCLKFPECDGIIPAEKGTKNLGDHTG